MARWGSPKDNGQNGNKQNANGNSGNGNGGQNASKCGICEKTNHMTQNCFQNPNNPKYKGPNNTNKNQAGQ